MNSSLRKELRTNLATNPFNDKFDSIVLNNTIQQHAPEYSFLVSIFESYHYCFNEHFTFLKAFLSATGYKKNELISILINFANHHYLCVLQEQFRKHAVKELGKIFSATTDYHMKGFGVGDVTGVSEAVVDTIVSLINFINKFDYKEIDCNTVPLTDLLDRVQKVIMSQSYLEVIKQAYETPVWRNAGYTLKDDKLYIHYENAIDLQSFEVAQYRMQQKLFDQLVRNELNLHNRRNDFFYNYPALAKAKAIDVNVVAIGDGFLRLEIITGNTDNIPSKYLHFISAIELYYPFLHNVELPGSNYLRLYDLLYLYSLLQDIFDRQTVGHVHEDFSSKMEFSHIADKITTDELEYYFLKKTTYSLQQIYFFLNVVSQPLQGRINLWDFGMYKHEYYFQGVLNPLLTAVPFHVMDTMLEKCGIDLDFRGNAFEQFIKKELSASLVLKGYYHKIAPAKVEIKRGKGKEMQEIDLLIFLQDTILIAEVKCIKYPMETRDRHNTDGILAKASRQIITKRDFLERNYTAITVQLGIDSKPRNIVPVIITNYPTVTGVKPGGIPVLDLSLISLYFNENVISVQRMTASKENLTAEILNTTVLYRNETEFSENLFGYCYDNPIINAYVSRTNIGYYKVGNEELLGNELYKQHCSADFTAGTLG